MSMYALGATGEQPFLGMEVLQLDPGLGPQEFAEFIKELIIPEHVDMTGGLVVQRPATILGDVIEMSRTPESPREPWAPDHHWHTDRAYWGENQFATTLYARELAGAVAGTELIDMTVLLETITEDDPALADTLAQGGQTIFSVRKYYEEVLAAKGSPASIARTLQAKGATTLAQVADAEAEKYPPKYFPTLPMHPFRRAPSLMVDEARAVGFTDLPPSVAQAALDAVIDTYLALPAAELAERPYYHAHEWEPGQVLIVPQIGTLHRAAPSPSDELRRDTVRIFIH